MCVWKGGHLGASMSKDVLLAGRRSGGPCQTCMRVGPAPARDSPSDSCSHRPKPCFWRMPTARNKLSPTWNVSVTLDYKWCSQSDKARSAPRAPCRRAAACRALGCVAGSAVPHQAPNKKQQTRHGNTIPCACDVLLAPSNADSARSIPDDRRAALIPLAFVLKRVMHATGHSSAVT